jgi:hypothetical protein
MVAALRGYGGYVTGTIRRDTSIPIGKYEVSRSAGPTGTLRRDTWAFSIGIEVSR